MLVFSWKIDEFLGKATAILHFILQPFMHFVVTKIFFKAAFHPHGTSETVKRRASVVEQRCRALPTINFS